MGASSSYLPDYARGEQLGPDEDSEDNVSSSKEGGGSTTYTRAIKQQQKLEEEARKKKMMIPLMQSMYKTYIMNSSIALDPECKASILQKKMVFTLNIIPILKLVPTSFEGDASAHKRVGEQLPKFYKVQSLEFEVPNIHEIMKLGGTITVLEATDRTEGDHFPSPVENIPPMVTAPGQISETVYLHPIDITVLNTISHLQIPLTLKLANIFFTREEVDQTLLSKTLKESKYQEWRTLNPLSSGTLRTSSPSLFVGDAFSSCGRFYSNGLHQRQPYRDSESESIEEEEEETCEERNQPRSFYGDPMVSTRYMCPSTGDHQSDLRRYKRLHELGEISNFKDVVIYIPAIGSIGEVLKQQQTQHHGAQKPMVVYKSPLATQIIHSNYRTPKEYLVSRVGHLDLSTSTAVGICDIDGLHNLTSDPLFSELDSSKYHLLALENVMTFMHSHEFFLGSDFMMISCTTVNRKRSALKLLASEEKKGLNSSTTISLPSHPLKEPVKIHYVGKIQNNDVIIEMGDGEKHSFNKRQNSSIADPSTTQLTPLDNNSGVSDTQNIYAIPAEFCESIRSQLETNVYQKMKFCDFSDPTIEVNTDSTLLSSYLQDLEDYVNGSIWNDYQQQRQEFVQVPNNNLHKCEQPLLPIIVTLEMNYLEIHHPNTLD